jgi:hypothetical protein
MKVMPSTDKSRNQTGETKPSEQTMEKQFEDASTKEDAIAKARELA